MRQIGWVDIEDRQGDSLPRYPSRLTAWVATDLPAYPGPSPQHFVGIYRLPDRPMGCYHGDESPSATVHQTWQWAANLAAIRVATIAVIKDAWPRHVPESRRDHTTPAETLRLYGLD